MTRLAPAVLELRIVAVLVSAVGAGRAIAVLGSEGSGRLWTVLLGAEICLAGLWSLWAGRTVRTAIRLALPTPSRGSREGVGRTVARAIAVQVLPVCLVVLLGARAIDGRIDGATGLAAGALIGVGLTGLLAASRVRRVERSRGQRILREPRLGAPLGRRSFFVEGSLEPVRGAVSVARPWPLDRPPRRRGSAYPVGVSAPPVRGTVTDPVDPSEG